ncbi:MAG TPA: hypothetical protein VHC94_00905 [Nitrobacter sp.]|jgi:hypothetical protein|nr:hypothetical protein [Nitrobacter sp.]
MLPDVVQTRLDRSAQDRPSADVTMQDDFGPARPSFPSFVIRLIKRFLEAFPDDRRRVARAKENLRVVMLRVGLRRSPAGDLDVIPGEFATHLYKLYSAKGWAKEEPFDRQWAPGEPRVLRDALHLIVDEGVRSKSDLLALEFTITAGDVENLTGLPPGWFMHEAATVVRLKPGSTQSATGAEKGGEVISFPRRE